MASQSSHIQCTFLFIISFILLLTHIGALEADRKVYVVYMGDRLEDDTTASSLHMSMLNEVFGSDASQYLLHSYKRSFNGFSVMLTEEEMQKFAEMEGVVSVFPSKRNELHTTRSWNFLGMPLKVKRSSIESDTIVGIFDTGIWPESESFSDKGYGPPPKKWNGKCLSSSNFTCNNKIIGARYYHLHKKISPEEFLSPRDTDGHGTHTASTVAGNVVNQASQDGLGLGTARGGVPSARIAVYKVCWSDGCNDHDILAAFDDAIADGVDIISISLGRIFATPYFEDGFAIGAFHAMKNGILTSQSAANTGPYPQTVTSVAPWILTVAASTIDRKFNTMVKLGNNMIYTGLSVNSFKLDRMYPLISAEDIPNIRGGFNGSASRLCTNGTLNKNLVKGKIILCDAESNGVTEFLDGAVGTVQLRLQNRPGYNDTATSFILPSTVLDSKESNSIHAYIKSSRNPTAIITKSKEGKDPLAPYVATFSSRGPNPISRNIIKPDLTAPGVDILAAWSPIAPPSVQKEDKRVVPYNIISGTSMACPHVSGVAAYIRTFKPKWSPAAIKSALMTTASPMSATLNRDAEFAYGAGHINPIKALNPGLVYDADEVDYIKFLCSQSYTRQKVRLVTGNKKASCSGLETQSDHDLNYPSFAVAKLLNEPFAEIFNRTVTNVGSPGSIYKANLIQPSNSKVRIEVEPKVLKFKSLGEKLSFLLAVLGGPIVGGENPIVSATLVWDDGMHQVRSPIVVYVPS